jgi:hypothetical protein
MSEVQEQTEEERLAEALALASQKAQADARQAATEAR